MGGSSTTVEAPAPVNAGVAAKDYLDQMGDPALQKKIFENRKKYDPQYAMLEMDSMKDVMLGVMGEDGERTGGGFLELMGTASSKMFETEQAALKDQREADVDALNKYSGEVVKAYRGADPYSAGTSDQMRRLSDQSFQRAQGVTPEQQRQAQQMAREGMSDRGRGYDTSTLATEILGREDQLRANRSEAANMGQVSFNMDRSMAGDLGSVILGRQSSAMGLGGNMLQNAQQMAPQMNSSGMFDVGQGINMAFQNAGNQGNYAAAMAGANAQKSAGMMGMVGSIAGAGIGAMAI